MSSKEMEQQFQDEIEEAPYIAKLRSILTMSFRYQSRPSQLLDHLYIGSEEDSTNLKLLRDLGITHVLNCAAGYTKTSQEFYGDIKYLGFEAEDDDWYPILQHFEEAHEFIESARKANGKVLVHCLMGINRSGAISVAHWMVHKRIGPITATKLAKKARTLILSNEGFQRQLVTFARQRGLLLLDKDEL